MRVMTQISAVTAIADYRRRVEQNRRPVVRPISIVVAVTTVCPHDGMTAVPATANVDHAFGLFGNPVGDWKAGAGGSRLQQRRPDDRNREAQKF